MDFPRVERQIRLLRKSAPIPAQFIGSGFRTAFGRGGFQHVDTFCLFIGHGRSGHSVVGSLLDAHPSIVIGHELNAVRYLRLGFRQNQLFDLLVRSSEGFSARGRTWSGYASVVPGQWQGTWETDLAVVGDKKGFSTSWEMRHHPELLDQIRKRMNVRIRWFHVFRNPYDNVSTMYRRRVAQDESLASVADRYLLNCETVRATRNRLDSDELMDLCHEDFIANPARELERACGFLGQSASEEYLSACASIVFKEPRRTRDGVDWPRDLIERFQGQFAEYPHLRRYSFET